MKIFLLITFVSMAWVAQRFFLLQKQPAKASTRPRLQSITMRLTPTIMPTISGDVFTFVYPHARILGEDRNTLILESTDDSQTIASWYKAKVQNSDFHTTTAVTTNTNGVIADTLVGETNDKEVRIQISKEADQSVVTISIALTRISD